MEELSIIIHTSKIQIMGRQICKKLVDILPRQLFEVVIQAIVNGKIIARETLKPYKKDVTAKLVNNFFLLNIVYFYISLLLIFFILVWW